MRYGGYKRPGAKRAEIVYPLFAGTCPVCQETREDLVDYGQGVSESAPGRDGPPPYHWFIRYGPHYGGERGNLCPALVHEAHCASQRCDARKYVPIPKKKLI